MKEYLDLIRHIQKEGEKKEDRTGTGTISVFGYQMRLDLEKGFPLLTTKKVNLNTIIHELLWFIKGDTNIRYLVKNNVNIWNDWPYQSYLKQTGQEEDFPMHSEEWKLGMKDFVNRIIEEDDFAKEYGDLGPVYGHQWRNWNDEGIDQIKEVINSLKNNPESRRMLVTAWNPGVLPDTKVSFSENVANNKVALPPCHAFFQFYVADGKLSCQLYQRSADVFLGVPFNIASYALLTLMMAQVCGLEPGDFVHTFGDAHIYSNHKEQIEEQLARDTRPLPKIVLNPEIRDILDFDYEDFDLIGYDPHPLIKGKVAV